MWQECGGRHHLVIACVAALPAGGVGAACKKAVVTAGEGCREMRGHSGGSKDCAGLQGGQGCMPLCAGLCCRLGRLLQIWQHALVLIGRPCASPHHHHHPCHSWIPSNSTNNSTDGERCLMTSAGELPESFLLVGAAPCCPLLRHTLCGVVPMLVCLPTCRPASHHHHALPSPSAPDLLLHWQSNTHCLSALLYCSLDRLCA